MRPVYVYFLRDDPERVRSIAPLHASHWREAALRGYSGGPFADRSGGLITFEAISMEAAERLVDNDPFVTDGLVTRSWLKHWTPE